MSREITPEKITKPIQLLAAWLAGLILVDGTFLTAAHLLTQPTWLPAVLAIAAVANVPLFLVALFMLQTRFRPEMQEDTYYSQYLQQKQTLSKQDLAADISALRRDALQASERTITLVESIQQQSSAIADEVRTLALREQTVVTKNTLQRVEMVQHETRQQLSVARRDVEWAQVRVHVNKYLSNFSAIQARLEAAAIPIHELFGEQSLTLRMNLLTIGPGVPIDRAQDILSALGDGVGFIQLASDLYAEGKIYVGSYGYEVETDGPRVIALSSAMRGALLKPGLSLDQFLSAAGVRRVTA